MEKNTKMLRGLSVMAVLLISYLHAEKVPQRSLDRVDNKSLAQKIFDAERSSIASFAKSQPIVESYIQSLDPERTAEPTIDDAYFLGRVSLDADSSHQKHLQTLAFGSNAHSRGIQVNTGDRWPLYPDGYVDMLFVDVTDFDKETYELTYQGTETLNGAACIRVAVRPRDAKLSGRFVGEIWVDRRTFHSARIAGTFSPKNPSFFARYLNAGGISDVGLYFRFDSWRQEVAPGVWLPSYTYFDEKRMWNSGRLTTSFRLRGYIWVWHYQTTQQTAERSSYNPLDFLAGSGLLASPGPVESRLNDLVREITSPNGIADPIITCRIALTTPAEMFSVGNEIVVSRGLLNLVPDKPTLAALLAREIAHILLGHSRLRSGGPEPVFNAGRSGDFAGLGVVRSPSEEASAVARAMLLLKRTAYSSSEEQLNEFLGSLAENSANIPHLVEPIMGSRLFNRARNLRRSSASNPRPLELHNLYVVNSWEDPIVALDEPKSQSAIAAEASSGSH